MRTMTNMFKKNGIYKSEFLFDVTVLKITFYSVEIYSEISNATESLSKCLSMEFLLL